MMLCPSCFFMLDFIKRRERHSSAKPDVTSIFKRPVILEMKWFTD